MPSSISSSDPGPDGCAAWRRFARLFACTAATAGAFVYLFVVTVDPWDMLPLSPPWHRIPISTNARYSMPALAVSPRFDSAMIGTSTGRLLQPAVLAPLFGAHFVNLAMNNASAWEQDRILRLFLRHHPAPRAVLVGIDVAWCLADQHGLSAPNRPMPDWMYAGSPWRGYAEMMNLYAVQEAANQFMWLIGHKQQRFGSDGYTSFVPPDSLYDPRRVDAIFRSWRFNPARAQGPAPPPASIPFLTRLLDAIPTDTTKILWFPPTAREQQGLPGSRIAAARAACRVAIAAVARATPHAMAIDFEIPGPIADTRANFWDPLHYRQSVAHMVMADLAAAATGRDVPPTQGRVLVPLHP
ncbi:hypothetical protein [Gluconacetobacter takamatsuzukensis]|uniref:Uncharacterized protein n=1 Tax=Gluconacetobacter takamatsuzukensis TaxID=1286190 RepID=A0A7W4KB97_9PROT|nr:hypothetical protein [Gluconacetobacter takamatsuzukensis]MBB2203778.1 hypothetical protein [Gluconacetobacter takamatsuzukensis]